MALLDSILSQAVAAAIPFMPDLATIQELTLSTDASGGRAKTFTDTATDVPCVYEPMNRPTTRQVGDQIVIVADHKITMPSTEASSSIPSTESVVSTGRIVVAAHGNRPELVFTQPRRSLFSGPIVQVYAVLQGV